MYRKCEQNVSFQFLAMKVSIKTQKDSHTYIIRSGALHCLLHILEFLRVQTTYHRCTTGAEFFYSGVFFTR